MDEHETAPAGRRHVPLEPGPPEDAPAQPLACATVGQVDDAILITVHGEIDLHTAPRLRALLRTQLEQRPRLLVIDLTQVSFLSSSGIAALLDANDAATRAGSRLRLACLPDQVRRTLVMTSLITWFAVYEDVRTALS